MDAAPLPPTPPPPPAPGAEPVPLWTRQTQQAVAFLAFLCIVLIGYHAWGRSRFATRPTERRSATPNLRVDLNRADASQLQTVPGIGSSLAARIEESRRSEGPFRSLEDLRRVPGVGPALLDRLRPWVRVAVEEAETDEELPPPGMRLSMYPAESEPSPAVPRPAPVPRSDEGANPWAGRKPSLPAGPIDLNRATLDELQALPGIGPKLAARIIEERGRRPFVGVDDLRRVSGIGPKTLDKLRSHVRAGKD